MAFCYAQKYPTNKTQLCVQYNETSYPPPAGSTLRHHTCTSASQHADHTVRGVDMWLCCDFTHTNSVSKKTQYFKVHSNHQFPSPIQRSLCQPSQLLSPGSAISDGTPLWSKRAEICVRFIVWWFMRIQQSLFLFLVFKKGTAAYCEIRWWCYGIHMKKIKSSKLQYQKQYNYKHN